MTNLILDNISLIILLPLWICLIIMCGRFFSVYVNKRIIFLLTLFSSALGAAVCASTFFKLTEGIEYSSRFININEFSISFGLYIDKVSLLIALILFIISFAIQLFSISYMKNEQKIYKFFAYLNLFNFAMSSMLFSPNLFQLYVFWELVGAVSYLLIGFDYQNDEKSKAAKRVFLMNRFGDTALLSGIIIVSYYMFSTVENYKLASLSFEDFNAISTWLMAYAPTPEFCIICGLFIIAAAVKSAQFPFYTWLQDAMEAKLPVSALLHSATMVAAGVFLIIRMMPFFSLNSVLLKCILIIGLVTAVICSILASVEINPKKILAYSTSANFGLMFSALGIANIKAAIIFLTAHAFIKSYLFVLLPKEKNIPKINFILFIAGALTLAGLILSGVGAKELIFVNFENSRIISYLFMMVCFISAFYIIRLLIIIYKNSELSGEKNNIELGTFLILLFGNIVLYIILLGSYSLSEPYAAAIGGAGLAILTGKHNNLERFNKTPKLLEKFYNKVVSTTFDNTAGLLNFIENRFFANYKQILFFSKIPVKVTGWIEENVMNKSVSLICEFSKNISKHNMIMQSGNVQTYNAYAFIIVTAVIAFVIICYTLIFE